MSRPTKYVVAVYNRVGGGDVLGVSPVMDSEEAAWAWLRERPAYHAPESPDGRMQVVPHGSGELRWQVLPAAYDDPAAECCDAVKAILRDSTRSPEKRCSDALRLVEESEERWLPPSEWAVDVVFSPATCVHGVVARSAAEAERKVAEMLDSGALSLSGERGAAIMDMLPENVETVRAVGREGEDA